MSAPTKRLSQNEFIALMAMIAATTAFSIDAMLPALSEIGAELSPQSPNRAQLMITSFVLGMGLGTFFTGPLSDAFGRRPVMVGGAILYCIACVVAWFASTLELMLAARVIMGIGAAGPRVVAMAMTRDIYAGRDMARIMSFIMVVFSLVPALAPTLGNYIMLGAGWRMIFVAFVVFAAVSTLWLLLRQPETLAVENRRPIRIASLIAATAEMFSHHTARLSIIIQTLTFGMLFSVLSSTQQVFDITFDQGEAFHLWFGGIAIVAVSGSLLNARFVGRLGMRKMVRMMYTGQVLVTAALITVIVLDLPDGISFAMYLIWVTTNFFQAGLTIGNLNALAMEEMGHIAGVAASIIAAVSTIGAVILAAPIAFMFDGTPLPMAVGALVLSCIAFVLTTRLRRPGDAAE